jgi:hypothetical protein
MVAHCRPLVAVGMTVTDHHVVDPLGGKRRD